MNDSTTKKETILIIAAGLIIGAIAVGLVFFGNPANMGFCIACFIRDTTGALGFHSAAVQYIRPEIVGLVLGAFILALVTKEFKPRGGSAPVTRFVIAMFVMIGCLMFLFLRFHFAFHHPLDCSAEEVTQSILYILRGLYVIFLDQSRDDLSLAVCHRRRFSWSSHFGSPVFFILLYHRFRGIYRKILIGSLIFLYVCLRVI